LCSFSSISQEVERSFNKGQIAYYSAYYKINFIWLKVGDVTFLCDSVKYRSYPAWHFKAIGNTLNFYDMFYAVRDTFESYITYKNFNPLYFKRIINQGKVHSFHQYEFLFGTGEIKTVINRNGGTLIKDRINYIPGSYDLLSSAYVFSSYHFDGMKEGQKIYFNIIIDNNNERLYFIYLGKEIVKTDSGRKFMCHKICVSMMKGDFFTDDSYTKVWFTADKNRLPLRVETKIIVGSVHALLGDVKNTRYPLTSEIK